MTKMAKLIFCLSTWVLLTFGSCVCADQADNSEISFSLPIVCQTGRGGDRTRCLADRFKPGLRTVLLSSRGTCAVRTADTLTYEHHVEDFEATRLVGNEKCLGVEDNEELIGHFRVAIVGADPSMVREVFVKEDRSRVPKEILLSAKRLAFTRVDNFLSDAQPKVFRTENVTVLIFQLQSDGVFWEPGPTVVLTKGEEFLLEGACTYGEPLFSVSDKLYLMYQATVHCCGCGDMNYFVYDFSGATPKKVYQNWRFAD